MGPPDPYPLKQCSTPNNSLCWRLELNMTNFRSVSVAAPSPLTQRTGTAPDYYGWEKWKLGWIDDNQVSCVSGPGTLEHTLTPLGSPGGVKVVVIKLNATMALNIVLRTQAGLDADTCSQGLLFYTVGVNVPSGKGPIRVVDTANGKGCSAGRGGKLSGAAQDFRKGVKMVGLAQCGISVKVNGLQGENYKLTVSKTASAR
jgi:hypothetical protein